MASVKELKKDIDNLIFQLVSDCFVYSGLHPDNKTEEVSEIIADAVNLRNDLIARVNNPEGKDDPKIIRSYYRSVNKDLVEGADQLFNRLSQVTKKKKK
jgi:hypothetical protein